MLYGEIAVSRHLYQTSGGVVTRCPMEVEAVATGFDGTTAPIRGEAYKKAMCGTIALCDQRGEQLSTEYLGAMPEAGKADFSKRFTSRIAQVSARYPKAIHVVLSDGGLWKRQCPGRSVR
jgi:hypothetical protein